MWLSQVPDDALDLALNTVYVHSRDTLVPKSYMPMQPETLGRETWRVLRNEIKVPKLEFVHEHVQLGCRVVTLLCKTFE